MKKHLPDLSRTEIISIFVIAGLFILSGYMSSIYRDELELLTGDSIWGPVIYVFVLATAIVAAPLSALPAIPVASTIWGPFLTGILSILGWTLGAGIAFSIARRFGRPIAARFVNLKRVDEMAEAALGREDFWTIVILRVVLPADVLSYALGLFGEVKFSTYIFATFLGVIPFAFIYSYAASLPIWVQVVTGILSFLVALVAFIRIRKRMKATDGGTKDLKE